MYGRRFQGLRMGPCQRVQDLRFMPEGSQFKGSGLGPGEND